ncbi:MAG: hypothetical protein WC514_03465 [Candidatus Paceibacterota bacterium]
MAIGIIHGMMTRDILSGLVGKEQLKRFVKETEDVDFRLAHGHGAGHRVGKFQIEFEKYGGKICLDPGAEYQAVRFIREGNLAWAVHFILDGACPEHIFPFREDIFRLFLSEPHMNFSLYLFLRYKRWSDQVKNASVTQVNSLEDLKEKIVETADWVYQLPCSYLREDDVKIIDPRIGKKLAFRNWEMSDDDIGKILERTSSLIKGAYNFVSK